nr:hypothetical protein [Tanacetum cinerariifolium]
MKYTPQKRIKLKSDAQKPGIMSNHMIKKSLERSHSNIEVVISILGEALKIDQKKHDVLWTLKWVQFRDEVGAERNRTEIGIKIGCCHECVWMLKWVRLGLKLVGGGMRTMATTIEKQVALDEALVPIIKRLRIGRSNFRLPSDIQSKESTLQVATTYVHQHSIRFKTDTRKNIVDLEAFREMLHISPRVPGQSFDELPFKEEILDFLRFLGHSAQIKTLTDANVNKLFQPWRSFAAVINKCLTGKSSGFDSLKLSQAQILWGLYHKRNIDYAFLIWEYFVYQVEHKNQKKSNEMYYPRFTKVIIHHFMAKKPSIPRQNKVNWHYVRDDILFSTTK